MLATVSGGRWKKFFILCFVASTIFLTVSYYDDGKILAYQVLISPNKDNITLDSNSIQVLVTNKTEPLISTKENVTNIYNSTQSCKECQNKTVVKYNKTSIVLTTTTSPITKSNITYLVSSSKCKIIDLQVFSPDAIKYYKKLNYKPCTSKKILTHVLKDNNTATVIIDKNSFDPSTVSCCYSNVTRKKSKKDPDASIHVSDCKGFQNNFTITTDAAIVKCHKKSSKEKVYENAHTSVLIREDVQKKLNEFNSSAKPLSVVFVGIDSISRLNFARIMPETYKYVEENEWISLKGYNKMDDNTFPNLMAILTGFNQTTAYKICNPRELGFLDKCPMLWYKFRNYGFVTGYAEDEVSITTFNYKKKGFIQPPTDYYFRPYVMATEKLEKVTVDSLTYCTGPETAGERIMNLVQDFATTFKDHAHFGFFWMNSFSHNNINSASRMDSKVKHLLTNLEQAGVYNNTLVVFLSDHGMRFGDFRLTPSGWQEERLPYIYFSFPAWFKEKFPELYNNFKSNVNKLTTPYDLHITLQHILVLSGFNHTIKPSDACPDCLSLFDQVPAERSCEEAGIVDHWCTCEGYIDTKLDKKTTTKLEKFFLKEIEKIIGNEKECMEYNVESMTTKVSHGMSYKTNSNALLYIKTKPKAVFEATVKFKGDIISSDLTMGDISRLDFYGSHSNCMSDDHLKKYCYCK